MTDLHRKHFVFTRQPRNVRFRSIMYSPVLGGQVIDECHVEGDDGVVHEHVFDGWLNSDEEWAAYGEWQRGIGSDERSEQ